MRTLWFDDRLVHREILSLRHAEIRLQAFDGTVGRVHGAEAAVAAESHRVGDMGVHPGGTVWQADRLIADVPVSAHVLVDSGKWALVYRLLEDNTLYVTTVNTDACIIYYII